MFTLDLKSLNTSDLCSIFITLNEWQWDLRLGPVPDNWNNMTKQEKYNMLQPVMYIIMDIVPYKNLLGYWHFVKYGTTDKEFEIWWGKNKEDLEDFITLQNIIRSLNQSKGNKS